ncbi:MAG: hypothetical protein JXA24_00700 [Proteobacteria bacterium]|nr:hypothetical protein [Pseudomonadota bacterium]
MHIGPLTLRPPMASLVGRLDVLFNRAGVLEGGAIIMPAPKLGTDGRISFKKKETEYLSLLRVQLNECEALDSYARAGGNPLGDTRFVREAHAVESVFSMSTADIARAAKGSSAMAKNESEIQKILWRAELLKASTLRELMEAARAENQSNVLFLDNGLINKAARDAAYVSALVWRPGEAERCCESALFSMMSGILFMIGDTEEPSEVIGAFLASASLFSEAGMHFAAGLSSEVAASIEIRYSKDAKGSGSSVFRAAQRWLKAAVKVGDSDPAARLVAVHRGLLTAFTAGDDAAELRRRLLMFSAGIHGANGRHDDAAKDYLRLLLDRVTASGWSVHAWESVADLLEMARAAYERAGDPAGIVAPLESLQDMSRGIASHVSEEMGPLERGVESDPNDEVVRWRRAIARAKYGDFKGALADLKWIEMSHGGSPWLLCEMGHVYHLLADYFMGIGRVSETQDFLNTADSYMSKALELERANELDIPVLHARLGALYATMGRMDEAVEELERAETISPRSGEIREYLDKVLTLAANSTGDDNVVPLNPFRR